MRVPNDPAAVAPRQAHLITPLLKAAEFVRDLWSVLGVMFLINAACNAALTIAGVTP
jgi:hypothetical protein